MMSSSNNTKADIQPQATGIAELFEKSSSEIVEKMNNFRRKNNIDRIEKLLATKTESSMQQKKTSMK